MREAQAAMEEAARAGTTMTYTELVEKMTTKYAPNGAPLTDILCTLSRSSYKRGKGMIAAVVVRADNRLPGKGFYDVARELGVPGHDEASTHAAALEQVHAVWAAD